MPPMFPPDDILGRVTWDKESHWWKFQVGPINGRSVRAKIIPDLEGAIPDDEWLTRIRACVTWLRANESQLRKRVAEDMFDYWLQNYYDEDEDDIDSIEEFTAAISVRGINFVEGAQGMVYYDDGGLFGNHGIWVEIDGEGRFVSGPDFA